MILRFNCVIVILLAIAPGALAGEAEWSAHTKGALAAYWRGDQLGAAKNFAAALKEAESFGESDRRLASTINNLALLYSRQGRHAEAEALYVRAMGLDEKALGPAHPDFAATLNNIAELYRAQARYAEAEPLYRRSLTIVEKALGPNHTQAGTTLNNLAELYRAQDRGAEAEPLYRRAYAIREKAHGPNHPDVAATLGQLAELYRAQGLYAQAEPLYRRALLIEEQVLGADHPDVATTLARQGDMFRALGKPADAEPLYKRALAIREKALGADHVEVARTLGRLADLSLLQGRPAEAETGYARALRITEQTLGAEHPESGMILYRQALAYNAQGKRELALAALRRASAVLALRVAQGEHRPWIGVFEDHVRLLAATGENASAQMRAAALTEGFSMAQTARAAGAVAQSASLTARYVGGRDALSRYARARQEAMVRLKQVDTQLMQAVARPPRDRDAMAEGRLRDEAAQARNAFVRLDGHPEGDPARQADLASPKPLQLREAQQLLAEDEALAMLMVLPDRSFLWVVRRDAAGFFPLPLRKGDLAEMVNRLGGQLEARGDRQPADPPPLFDVTLAHALFRSLFLPAEALLAGVKHLILVPDGALASLPPGVLVTTPADKPIAATQDYAQVAWLVKRHAVTVLPSVAALRTRRQAERPSAAREAFRGFGELQDLARALKLSPNTVMSGAMASETAIKGANLARFRGLAFAAPESLVRGPAGVSEPALVMVAPASASAPGARNDGLLAASQIAQLRLEADWVLLAANPSPDDAAAEGRATLARSFLHAGARSVLVSYGSASPRTTAELTARVAEESAAGVAKAEALRRSMLALMNVAGEPQLAHPRFWAGLSLVGEGNARWSESSQQAAAGAATAAVETPAEQTRAAVEPRPAPAENQDNAIAKAVAAVTGFLGQIGRSRDATPPPPAQLAEAAVPKPAPAPEVKPAVAAAPKPAPEPEVKPAVAAAPKPAPAPEVKPAVAAAPPPAEAAAPRPASEPEVKRVIAATPPRPETPTAPAVPLPPERVDSPVETPVPESGGANPITQAIEGVGAMLKKMFSAQAEPRPEAPAETMALANSAVGAPAPNWSAPSGAEAPPAPAAEEGNDPVSQIIRDVGAALARLLAPAPSAEAPAERSDHAPAKEPAAVPAPNSPSTGTELRAESSPPDAPAADRDPIGDIFKEIGALITRLQLALKLQSFFERQPEPAGDAPLEAPTLPAGAVQGNWVLTADGSPVLTVGGNPVLTADGKSAAGTRNDSEQKAEDDPLTTAFRTIGAFLTRLLGGETAPNPPAGR